MHTQHWLQFIKICRMDTLTPTPEELARSAELYVQMLEATYIPQRIGLYGEDVHRSLASDHTYVIHYIDETGMSIYIPALVRVDALSWFNRTLLSEVYGLREIYFFTHPYLVDEVARSEFELVFTTMLECGVVIITDSIVGRDDRAWSRYLQKDKRLTLEPLGGGEPRWIEVYRAKVSYEGVDEVREADPCHVVYERAVAEGIFEDGSVDGASFVATITGEEAERLYESYRRPFEKLGEGHPIQAGFSKEDFLAMMADPEIAKAIHRVDGVITTLCFFVTKWEYAPWFDSAYYEEMHPEEFATGNVLLFPGIVTDERYLGNDYSLPVITLITNVMELRGSRFVISFECSEISRIYIPTLVKVGIEINPHASVRGLEKPVSAVNYRALRIS